MTWFKSVFRKALGRKASFFLFRWAVAALDAAKRSSSIAYHIAVVVLSAWIALSLPAIVRWIAQNFLFYWALLENEKISLMAVEIALAIFLTLFLSRLRSGWRDRKMAAMAKSSGMLCVVTRNALLSQRRARRLKEKQGYARDVMIIASTGFRTFVDPAGELHKVLRHCRDARVMLLDPYSEGAAARARSLHHSQITEETFRRQVGQSIEFLKALKAAQKKVRLKLYRDPPFLKLTVLGDYAWLKHYHDGVDVQEMPEYLFAHDQNPGGLYTALYRYFLLQWANPGTPEYDLDTDELVLRDKRGNPVKRESFRDSSGGVSAKVAGSM